MLIDFGMHLDFREFEFVPLKMPLIMSMVRGGTTRGSNPRSYNSNFLVSVGVRELALLTEMASSLCPGAPIAMAPEIVLPRPGPTTVLDYEHNDSWATGMMFHELLSPQGPSSPVQACSVRVACSVRI